MGSRQHAQEAVSSVELFAARRQALRMMQDRQTGQQARRQVGSKASKQGCSDCRRTRRRSRNSVLLGGSRRMPNFGHFWSGRLRPSSWSLRWTGRGFLRRYWLSICRLWCGTAPKSMRWLGFTPSGRSLTRWRERASYFFCRSGCALRAAPSLDST